MSCQETRDLTSNRKIARKKLTEKIDFLMHGSESKLGKKIDRIKKKKAHAARKSKIKYQVPVIEGKGKDNTGTATQ